MSNIYHLDQEGYCLVDVQGIDVYNLYVVQIKRVELDQKNLRSMKEDLGVRKETVPEIYNVGQQPTEDIIGSVTSL